MLESERRALLEARARLRARLSGDPDPELREQLEEVMIVCYYKILEKKSQVVCVSSQRSDCPDEATEETRAEMDDVSARLADAFKRTPLSAGGIAKDRNHFADPSVARPFGAEEFRIEFDRVEHYVGFPSVSMKGQATGLVRGSVAWPYENPGPRRAWPKVSYGP